LIGRVAGIAVGGSLALLAVVSLPAATAAIIVWLSIRNALTQKYKKEAPDAAGYI
jgi:hypothetical protein